jgi:uncharacterized protein (UPF0248 family)
MSALGDRMIPIHELLNSIRWNKALSQAQFVIGYYDRQCDKILHVPFTVLDFSSQDHFRFTLVDEEGELHEIPFHRVREVFRDGELIWHRQG